MASVRRLQPIIQGRVDLLLERLKGFRGTDEVLMASWAFAAFTNGVLSLEAIIGRRANNHRYRHDVLLWKMRQTSGWVELEYWRTDALTMFAL